MNRLSLENRVYAIHKLFFINFVLICFIIEAALAISCFYPPTIPDTSIFLPNPPLEISPKPLEQLIFQLCIVLIPLYSLGYIICNKVTYRVKSNIWAYIVPLLIGGALFYCFLDSEWTVWLFKGLHEFILMKITNVFLVVMIFSLVFGYFLLKSNTTNIRYRSRYKLLNWVCFITLTCLTLFAWRIYDISDLASQGNTYYRHLDAVLYPLSQVVKGKTVLADLPSQYGLFPEIIAPIFKLMGLSVFKFSLFMALLQIISMTLLYYVVTRLIKSQLIVFLVGCSLILLTFENIMYLSDIPEAYYQYWPIRFFWPAISVFMFFKFCKNKSMPKSGLISFMSAIATIWNLDTGVFIFISYAVYLAVGYIFIRISVINTPAMPLHWRGSKFLYAFVLHIIIFIVTIGGFFLILSMLATHKLDYTLLYKYQRIFYSNGFAMIDIPTIPDPWMIVISIYIYGLITSLNVIKANQSPRSELMLFLSILGIGLFTYYEGRSHPLNLFSVMWPALIISAMFMESSIHLVKLKVINLTNLIFPHIALTFFLICTFILIINIPKYYMDLMANPVYKSVQYKSLAINELNFIKKNTRPNSECLLWVKNQAAYYAQANLSSPISGPGLTETLLISDVNTIEKQIELLQPKCVILGAGSSEFNPGFDYDKVFENYEVVSQNKEGTLLLLRLQ